MSQQIPLYSPRVCFNLSDMAGITRRSVDIGQTREATHVLTVGHSTHPWDKFLGLLQAHGVQKVVDVRKIPRSRRNPQFSTETLSAALRAAKIGYFHMPGLGGLRRALPDSINGGWRNASFRGYADYMQTPEFAAALAQLIDEAQASQTVVMCAEAVPWRCHRSLIADALIVRGIPVLHIMTANSAQPHSLTEFARVEGHSITYPPKTSGSLY